MDYSFDDWVPSSPQKLVFISAIMNCCVYVISLSVVFNSLSPHLAASKALLSMEFYRQESWGRLPFPSQGDILLREDLPSKASSSPFGFSTHSILIHLQLRSCTSYWTAQGSQKAMPS